MEIYVHIPFCVRKCRYCDFYSLPCGSPAIFGCDGPKTRVPLPKTGDYVKAILKELDAREDEIRGKEITSIFIGGGTPTILPVSELEMQLMGLKDGIERRGGMLTEGAEITVECNPGTLDKEKLTIMRQLGVNRLSIGLQSADNKELAALGRIHTYEEFLKNYEEARKIGFDNINIDLMSGIPGQTAASCERTLNTVAGLDPEHISVYSLILEEGTPLYDDVEVGKVRLPGEDFDRDMYDLTGQILAAHGYERYEISNYAKPGRRCRHNMGYWTGEEYLGLGSAAASYLRPVVKLQPDHGSETSLTNKNSYDITPVGLPREDQKRESSEITVGKKDSFNMYRYKNPADLKAYMSDPAGVRVLEETLDREALMSEFMILRLRLTEGADRDEFKKRFGVPMDEVFGDIIKRYKGLGLMEDKGDCIALTSKGFDVANSVMCEFM